MSSVMLLLPMNVLSLSFDSVGGAGGEGDTGPYDDDGDDNR